MLEQLTYSIEQVKVIKEKINRLKVVLYSENILHIAGFKQVAYVYSDDEEKVKHSKEMEKQGYKVINAQQYVYIFHSFSKSEEDLKNMLVPCEVYEINIESSLSK